MDREKIIEITEKFCRSQLTVSDIAQLAQEMYEAGQRAERERIADDIIQLHQNAKNTELFLRELSYFVHELKGGNATAHAMFDEMQEALGK